MKPVIILAIESSCDDTAAAVCIGGKIVSNIVANQSIHEQYGGVVPELASRAHQQNIVPVVALALQNAQISVQDLSAVAFTQGPGLAGSLLVGTSFAKGLALGLDLPLIAVNHMQAHILAHFIDEPKPKFPFVCLTVSGGHTQIVLLKDYFDIQIVGQTLDDAAGEAFDKIAKTMGLPYPGGHLIDALAKKGDAHKFQFTKPVVGNYDFSFSGLKTNFLYFIQKEIKKNPDFIAQNLNDLCASVQKTIVDILLTKLFKCAKHHQINQIAIAGGVSANSELRTRLETQGKKQGFNTFIPRFEYCTDNAAMVAMVAHFKLLNNDFVSQNTAPNPRLAFGLMV